MPIVGHHVDQKCRVVFEMTLPSEVLTAKQMLSLDPKCIEVYQYFYGDPIPIPSDTARATVKETPFKLHSMIIDYIEVGHYEAAMDIMEMEIAYKRKPSISLLLALADMVLQAQPALPGKAHDDSMDTSQRAHRLLLDVLESWGADAFSPFWETLGDKKKKSPSRSKNRDEDDEDDLGNSLREFEDFWELVSLSFEIPISGKAEPTLMRRRMMLDILIKVLENDLRQRRDHTEQLASCVFLETLKKDSYGGHSQLGRYLDILFDVFQHTSEGKTELGGGLRGGIHAEGHDMAARLLNMFIVLSYCDNLVSASTFADQTFRRFAKLNADNCANLLQAIRCTTFISVLCDMVLADSNCTKVARQYKHHRKTLGAGFKVEKLIHYAMKTQPLRLRTMQDIYRHVLIVIWRFMSYINECSLRCDVCVQDEEGTKRCESKVLSGLMQNQLIEVVEQGPAAVSNWRDHIKYMISQVKGAKDEEAEQKIWWTIELAQISINSGL